MRSDCWGWSLLGAIVLSAELISSPAAAQIAPDGTTATTIDRLGDRVTIEGGDRAGGNLFHSFREFSIPTKGEAYFNNAVDITNIFSRVTGGKISNIDGLIRANGTANLFLLNPAGILFGPNARLELGGSFFGTTARSIQFADGVEFAADASAVAPLLTLSVPVGLQFGANPGAIDVRGNGYVFPSPPADVSLEQERQSLIDRTKQALADSDSTGLRVVPGQTLALIGAAVTLDRTALKASDGHIAIGAVAANQQINFAADELGFAIELPPVPETAIIANSPHQLSIRDSLILASGPGGGEILLWGDRVSIEGFSSPSSQEQSLIFADTLGPLPGRRISVSAGLLNLSNSALTTEQFSSNGQKSGDISIHADSIDLLNSYLSSTVYGQGQAGNIFVYVRDIASFDRTPNNPDFNGISSQINPDAGGEAGNIKICARSLFLKNGSQVSSSTSGNGDAGSVNVTVEDQLEAEGFGQDAEGTIIHSGIFSNVDSGGNGNAGIITVNADSISVRDGAQISSDTWGDGNAGEIRVTARDRLEIGSETWISSDVLAGANGNAGSVTVNADSISVRDGAQISSSTWGDGNAGEIHVTARDRLEAVGSGTGIRSNVNSGANGNAGSVTIEADSISVRDGAQISSDTDGNGDARSVTIDADSISIRGGAQISSSTLGNGNAGSVTVTVQNRLEAEGFSQIQDTEGNITYYSSGIFSNVNSGANGNAGSVTVKADSISVSDRAQISSDTDGNGDAGEVRVTAQDQLEVVGSGTFISSDVNSGANGNARSVTVKADSISVRDGAQISSSTWGNGDAGSVNVTVDHQLEAIGSGTFISSNVNSGASGNAGSVTVKADSISVRNGAQVVSDTYGNGNAGKVDVTARDQLEEIGSGTWISSDVLDGANGNAGSVTVDANSISVRDGAQISSTSQVIGFSAGDITLTANAIHLDNGARISAGTLGEEGDIHLQAETLTLRHGSEISTNAQKTSTGGNITIETQTLTALEDSDIHTDADQAKGGEISIRAQSVFGTAIRSQDTPESDITARSALGAQFSGTVQLTAPDVDPGSGLLQLPDSLVDVTPLLNRTFCHVMNQSGGSFTITGRGGIAITPDAFLDDPGPLNIEPLEPIARSTSPTDRPSIASESRPPTRPIVEANTWQREPDGRLILVAQGNAIAPPGLRLRDCPLPSTSAP